MLVLMLRTACEGLAPHPQLKQGTHDAPEVFSIFSKLF